jgi:cytoskeletal protein CcmA (bactofilin family)
MSFRKYGGTQYSAHQNIVRSNINSTDKFYVTQNIGQPNTYINLESDLSGNLIIYGDLDVSGNLHVQKNLDVSGNVDISGNTDINGNVDIN